MILEPIEPIEPIERKNLLDVLAELEPLAPEDEFPRIDDTLLPLKEVRL